MAEHPSRDDLVAFALGALEASEESTVGGTSPDARRARES